MDIYHNGLVTQFVKLYPTTKIWLGENVQINCQNMETDNVTSLLLEQLLQLKTIYRPKVISYILEECWLFRQKTNNYIISDIYSKSTIKISFLLMRNKILYIWCITKLQPILSGRRRKKRKMKRKLSTDS